MPFGKRGKLERKKGYHKKRVRKAQEKQHESSDDFFSRCLDSGFGIPSEEKKLDDDNLKADEYFLILDKPYQYYEHDDIDAVISAETARVFSKLKEDIISVRSNSFILNKHSNLIRLVSLYDENIVKLKVVVTVSKDFSVSIQVHEKELPSNHEIWTVIPRVCYTVKVLEKILNTVGSYVICVGNPDPGFQELIRVGSDFDSKDLPKRQGYKDNYTGTTSIFSTSCELLCKGTRCKNCNIYRGTLRSLHARKKKNTYVRTPEKNWLHSRIGNNNLSENQKFHKLKQLKEYSTSLEKELKAMKKKISSEIDNKGVLLSEDENQDFLKIMEGSNSHESFHGCKIEEEKYKKLFWDEQLKYNKLKDKRQMRWHPMLIKWCILLRSKSSSSYDLLRKSGFISLPSERLLYDYTHLVKSGTGYQPETIEMLFKEVYRDNDPEDVPKSRKIVGILHDEIRIKSDLVYEKNSGKLIGFVDLDKVGNDLNHISECLNKEDKQLAKHVLVVMVRGVSSSLKFPLAHFATSGVTSDQLFPILWKAVEILETDLGLIALFITSDGASPNRRFTRLHRKNNEEGVVYRTQNIFAPDNRFIYFISDPPHLLKTARNCFSNSHSHKKTRSLWNIKDISWMHIVDLFKEHCSDIYRYCPKLTREHVDISSYGCMKVSFAAQVLSETVASALDMLYGENTSQTSAFIRHMNKFFDCLNARHEYEGIRTRNPNLEPYRSVEDERLDYLLNEFLQFFEDWRLNVEGRPGNFTKSQRNSMMLSYQTLEGIEMTVKSVVECVKFCLNNGVSYVLTEKFNQDPIEQHFGIHRSSGGSNSNPTLKQFSDSMVRLRTVGGQALAPLKGNTKRKLRLTPIDNTPLPKRKRNNTL